jgi:hypothetical protein
MKFRIKSKKTGAVSVLFLCMFAVIVMMGCKSQKKVKAQAKEPEQNEVVATEKPELVTPPKIEEPKTETTTAKDDISRKLNQMFASIANSGNSNSSLATKNEVLNLFSSPNVPVLIVIYEGDKVKDHDKPTTIKSYLEYLGITRNNNAMIKDLEFNENGLITLLELRKNYTTND